MPRIELPHAPLISGLKARTFNPEHDYPEMLRVFDEVGKADNLENTFTVQSLQHEDAVAREFNPRRDRFLVQMNDETIGVGTVCTSPTLHFGRLYHHTFDLVPRWRRKGIGRSALACCQRLLLHLAA